MGDRVWKRVFKKVLIGQSLGKVIRKMVTPKHTHGSDRQRTVRNNKINDWRDRLKACALAKCGHYEHQCGAPFDTNSIN